MPNTNPQLQSPKQGPSVSGLLIGVIIAAFLLWLLPIFLGNHTHVKPNPEAIFRVFIIISSIIVGLGLLADIFPNPVSDKLHIVGTDVAHTTIVNTYGAILLKSSENTIDVSNLSAGFYIACITDNHGNRTARRFVKK